MQSQATCSECRYMLCCTFNFCSNHSFLEFNLAREQHSRLTMSHIMFQIVTEKKFQLAVQEFKSALKTPPKGQRRQNEQIRHCLEIVVHELATCADLMVPAIQTLAASKPSLQRLKELSENGGKFTMNHGRREVDYGNF